MNHFRHSLFFLFASGVFLSRFPGPAVAQRENDLFEQCDVVTDITRRPTILTGTLLGGATEEIILVHVDESDDGYIQLYGFDGSTWVPVLEAMLRPEVMFVEVATIGGHDRLITYVPGHLAWFDPDSATERTLVEIDTSYRATKGHQIPRLDITRDLNRDGRDDLVMPDVDGFWISTQLSDGSFADAVKLGPAEPFARTSIGGLDFGEPVSEGSRTYGDTGVTAMTTPVYLSRIHQMDYNQDGRSDLLFWNLDQFDVYLQDSSGGFASEPVAYAPALSIDFDGVYSRSFDYRDQGVTSMIFGYGKKTQRTVLHSLRDVNGDSIEDLVTLTLTGRSLLKQRSLFEVHIGSSTPDGVRFAPEASAVVRAAGKAGGMQPWGYSSQWFEDIDGDGQVDIVLRDVKVGWSGISRALLGNSVPINLEFYRSEDGIYPDKPATTRKIRRFAPLDGPGNIFFPAVMVGDVNGDGRSDLMVGQSPKELRVFLGVPGPDLLARQHQKVTVALPYDERDTWLVDLNKDGKQDLLIRHGPNDHDPNTLHRLTVLIAR